MRSTGNSWRPWVPGWHRSWVPLPTSTLLATDRSSFCGAAALTIGAPPTDLLGWFRRRLFRRLVRLVLAWSLVSAGIIGVFFGIVAARKNTSVAYNLLTLHISPMGAEAGVPGVVLGTLGYLLVPAVVGAIVSAIFTGALRVSKSRYESDLNELTQEVRRRIQSGDN